MLYAIDEKTERKIKPEPGLTAVCSYCESPVIAKCGSINIWHWAHKSLNDCDVWGEGETNWHLEWKSHFNQNQVEINIKKDNSLHRADIVLNDGTIVELQHSFITPETISERESFYGNMIWIFDLSDCISTTKPKRFCIHQKKGTYGRYYSFNWLYPKKHIFYAKQRKVFDLGDGTVFIVKEHYKPKYGWGDVWEKQRLVDWLKSL